jgi:uncharacterized membrane protein
MRSSYDDSPNGRLCSIHEQARATGVLLHGEQGLKVVADCVIRRPASELYKFCRNSENLPRVIGLPLRITPTLDGESHWVLSTPFDGSQIAWDAVIINDEPDTLLAWQSLYGAPVPNAWTIRFSPAPGGWGTKVTVQLEFDPPSPMAALFNGLLGKKTKQQVTEALARFKELMEGTRNSGR